MADAGRVDVIRADWIAADWGTSNLRAWAMDAGGRVLAAAASARGMGGLAREGFEPALLELVGGWIGPGRTEVVICGMAGARQGWAEASYAPVPCAPLTAARAVRAPAADPRLSVRILPGLSQRRPADVMRGEETQIAGALAAEPDFDGVMLLPGTHTKWAHVTGGEVVSFRTFMTGELFALLAERSVLRHSVGAEGWDEAAFAEALEDGLAKPEAVAARLFSLRAEALLEGLAPEVARARLSGLLLGLELAAAKPWWLGRRVLATGSAAQTRAYGAALARMGGGAERREAEAATLDGLRAARAALGEERP